MKKLQRIMALFLIACMLVPMIPTASAAGGYERIDYAYISPDDPDEVMVNLLVGYEALLMLGLYDKEGKFITAASQTVTGPMMGTVKANLPEERPANFDLKVFLLDSETYAPLCESFLLEDAGDICGYSITGIEIGDGTVTAQVSTAKPCDLHITIRDEDLGTSRVYKAEADGDLEMDLVTAELSGTLPEYYYVEAMLVGEYRNRLCPEFVDRTHTRAYQAYAAQTEDDFRNREDVTLLDVGGTDDGNFMVLSDNVTYLGDAVTFTGENEGVLTFENADETLTGLAVGDCFAFTNADGEHITVKIKEITVADGVVSVTRDETVYVSDFYDVIKINANLYYEAEEGTVPEPAALNSSAAAVPSSQLLKVEFGPAIGADVTTPFASAEGKVRAGGKIAVNYDPENLDYMDMILVAGVKGELDVTLGAAKDWKDDVTMGSIPLTGLKELAGLSLNVELVCDIDAEIGYNFKLEFEQNYGFIYSTDTGMQTVRKNRTTQKEASSQSQMRGKFEAEVGVRGELSASLLNELIEASVGAEGGVRIEAELDALSGTLPSGLDSYHACDLCANGNCKTYFEIDFTLDYEINPWLKGNLVDLDFIRIETTIGSFYLSLINEADSVHKGKIKFDWADQCPNKKYKITVVTLDNDGKEVEDCITTVHRGSEVLKTFDSPGSLHLYPGTYGARAEIGQNMANIEFTVTDAAMTVYLSGADNELKGQVTNRLSGAGVSGANLKFSQSDTVVNSATTDATGHYSVKLPDGSYTIAVSADGYESKNTSVEMAEDRELDVALEPCTYTLSFDANGGTGTMEDVEFYAGQNLTLPACGFTAPEGMIFSKWELGGTVYAESDSCTMEPGNQTAQAVWAQKTGNVTVTVLYEDGTPAAQKAIQWKGQNIYNVPFTGSSGKKTFTMAAGSYYLYAEDTDSGLYGGQWVTVEGDMEVTITLGEAKMNWSFDEKTGKLTVTGNGPMREYDKYIQVPWLDVKASIKTVEITGITSISKDAFRGYENLTEVKMANGLQSIAWGAFAECEKLVTAVIPESVEEIDHYTFYKCASLTTASMPTGIEYFPQSMYRECTSLTSVEIPEGVTTIGFHAFDGCTALTDITIPDGVEVIYSNAFANCTSLTKIVLPESVSYLDHQVFWSCENLREVVLPKVWKNESRFGERLFEYCSSLTSVTIPDGVKTIPIGAFRFCESLTSITIPASVKYIYSSAVKAVPITDVYFEGTQEQWDAIGYYTDSGTVNPYWKFSATIHCNPTAE